jgi:pimeloyl-ACP methyl ester carboxylesterase
VSEPAVEIRTIDGLRTGSCVTGDGRPVVALHGWSGSVKSFWPVAERLAPLGYEVHLIDLPGFGESDLPPQVWGVEDYQRFVMAYLDDRQIERTAILGHSFGGRVGLMLAAEHPERVTKMVLANAAGLRTSLSLRQQTRNFFARTLRQTLNTLGMDNLRARWQDRYNRRYASEDYLNAGPLRDTFVRVIEQDLSAYAARVKAPTVLVWGSLDKDTPLWQGRRLEQLIPDAGLIVFEGAGHFSYLERLHDFVRIVDHFLSDGG